MIRLIDSTTIGLNINQFTWAHFRSSKAGIKLHTVYDPVADTPVFFEMTTAKASDRKSVDKLSLLPGITYAFDRAYDDYAWYYQMTRQNTWFAGRMKSSAVYEVIESRPTSREHIPEDQTIRLTSDKGCKQYPAHHYQRKRR